MGHVAHVTGEGRPLIVSGDSEEEGDAAIPSVGDMFAFGTVDKHTEKSVESWGDFLLYVCAFLVLFVPALVSVWIILDNFAAITDADSDKKVVYILITIVLFLVMMCACVPCCLASMSYKPSDKNKRHFMRSMCTTVWQKEKPVNKALLCMFPLVMVVASIAMIVATVGIATYGWFASGYGFCDETDAASTDVFCIPIGETWTPVLVVCMIILCVCTPFMCWQCHKSLYSGTKDDDEHRTS